jgi:hypothetical protein
MEGRKEDEDAAGGDCEAKKDQASPGEEVQPARMRVDVIPSLSSIQA